MMTISQKGIDLIKSFEGFSNFAYLCPAGYETIGYGHKIKDDEEFDSFISKDTAQKILQDDLKGFEKAINELVFITLTQNQYDALVSFVYNIGVSSFEKSTMLKLLNTNRVGEASLEFSKWVYAKGKKLKGLERRRELEKKLFDSI